jgi:hypothetical protein
MVSAVEDSPSHQKAAVGAGELHRCSFGRLLTQAFEHPSHRWPRCVSLHGISSAHGCICRYPLVRLPLPPLLYSPALLSVHCTPMCGAVLAFRWRRTSPSVTRISAGIRPILASSVRWVAPSRSMCLHYAKLGASSDKTLRVRPRCAGGTLLCTSHLNPCMLWAWAWAWEWAWAWAWAWARIMLVLFVRAIISLISISHRRAGQESTRTSRTSV